MMLLQIDEEEQSISFVTFVVDSSDGGMNEQTLKTALSIVSNTHEHYSGDWNDGFSYFISPAYYIEDSNDVSAGWLQEQLKAFVDAYLFLEANIHMLCDSSLWGLDMKADGNDKNIEGD